MNKGEFPQLDIQYLLKTTDNITLNYENLNACHIGRIKSKIRLSALTTIINIVLEFLAKAIRQEKSMKGLQIRKEENKILLFEDDKMVSIENPIESTKQNKEIKT